MSSERSPAALSLLERDYEIVRELGRGGTAVVYLARERETGDEVAIKLIRAKFIEDEEALARLAREARFVEQLDHPNVVAVRAVIDLGDAGIALVMAHVQGRTLKQLIKEEHPIPPERVVSLFRDVAAALGAAHALGIVHRDVKPENIFVDDSGRALLADFGVARSMTGDSQLTMSGVAIGTPAYMAPEQIDGTELDGRGDIYSLGLVGWEMLTGHRPWEGESLYAILYHQRHHSLPDVRDMRPDVPERLADVIAVAIEKEPEARWQTVEELLEVLDSEDVAPLPGVPLPVDSATVKFIRPLTPAPLPPPGQMVPAPFIEAANEVSEPRAAPIVLPWDRVVVEEVVAAPAPRAPSPFTRQRIALGAAVLAAAVILGLMTSVRGDPSDDEFAPQDAAYTQSASGELGRAGGQRSAAGDSLLVGGMPDSLSVEAAIMPALPPAGQDSAESRILPTDAAVGVQLSGARPAPEAAGVTVTSGARPIAPGPSRQPPAAELPAPVQADPPERPARVSIVTGGMHTCLVNAEQRAFCWGGNGRGQLGTGATTRTAAPEPVGADLRLVTLAPGLSHTCAIARGGAAWCWGENDRGQLGDRSTIARSAPVRVANGHPYQAIAAGASHSCALDADGAAWCWGANGDGQLGDGASTDRHLPFPVSSDDRFSSIHAGWNFSCALRANRAMCWGDNSSGQLGDGTTMDRRVPTMVQASAPFRTMTAGSAHACGLTPDGEAYCWGRNAAGELGDGTTSAHSTPVRVRVAERLVAITAGAVHTCAVDVEGEAWCWGRNTYGQLGNGGTSDRVQPTRVAGGHTFASVRAFGSHTCGATVAGEAFCWGYNLDGQLGDGSRTHRTRPVYVERPGG